jgi:hypothetical protein
MQKDIYFKIIGFLQGASWAIVLIGAFFTFKFTISFGLSFCLFSTILYLIFSLLLILLLDAFSVHKEKLEELKKQTKLLEKLTTKDSNL